MHNSKVVMEQNNALPGFGYICQYLWRGLQERKMVSSEAIQVPATRPKPMKICMRYVPPTPSVSLI